MDADQQVFRAGLGILNNNIEIAIVIKESCFDQLIFRLIPPPPAVLLH